MRDGRALVERELAARQRQTEATSELHKNERELSSLSILARPSRRRALRQQIADGHATVAGVERELAGIHGELQTFRKALARTSRAQEPPVRRLAVERTLERDVGLEL
jgi:hypothetical protein